MSGVGRGLRRVEVGVQREEKVATDYFCFSPFCDGCPTPLPPVPHEREGGREGDEAGRDPVVQIARTMPN